MRRFIVAILCLILATPIIAQVPTTANVTAQLAEQTAKREETERKLLIREAADELEAAQTEQAYNRFEIWTGLLMGGFSVLITILVIFFALRTEKTAIAAAKEEVTGAKADIDRLVTEAQNAAAAASAAQEELAETKAEIDALLMSIRSDAIEAEKNAGQIAQTERSAAQILSRLNRMNSSERATIKLSLEEKKIVEAAAHGSADKPEQALTIDEYKAQIGQARYIFQDWEKVLRLAKAMARHHVDDDEALAFALIEQADAYHTLSRHVNATTSYGEVIQRFRNTKDSHLQEYVIRAMHHKCYSLIENGNANEAENNLQELIAMSEQVYGVDHSQTLSSIHNLGSAILEQGRAKDAEIIFRDLLPRREQVDDPMSRAVLLTRLCLARAVFENGNIAEASEILAVIPVRLRGPDWRDNYLGHFAFFRAKVCDALGKRGEADDWLAKAETHYTAAFPPDHYYRKQFDAYVAARERQAS